jgi:hypothetical protein
MWMQSVVVTARRLHWEVQGERCWLRRILIEGLCVQQFLQEGGSVGDNNPRQAARSRR